MGTRILEDEEESLDGLVVRARSDSKLKQMIQQEIELYEGNSDDFVDFCNTKIYRRELEALREVYALIGEKPEGDYISENKGRILIEEGHVCCVNLMYKGLQSLPESVGNWINLRAIYLYNNKLTSLPDSVGNWNKLQRIDLDHSHLSSLPDSVENWKNLQYIWLNNTPIATNEAYIAELKRKLPKAEIETE
jgi:hypothetical protein